MLDAENNKNILKEISIHSQKITEALYRITDFFSSKEPLKWILREEGMKIFRLVSSLEALSLNKKISNLDAASQKIEQIISLFEIAASNSFMANANFEVLKREYNNLKNAINSNKALYLPFQNLQDIDFLTDSVSKLTLAAECAKPLLNNNQEPLSFIKEPDINTVYSNRHTNGQNTDIVSITDKKSNNTTENRTNKLLDIIKSKPNKKIGVCEVFSYFEGISKKTVQRDLINLVRNGNLKAEGEKRWRKYTLISS